MRVILTALGPRVIGWVGVDRRRSVDVDDGERVGEFLQVSDAWMSMSVTPVRDSVQASGTGFSGAVR